MLIINIAIAVKNPINSPKNSFSISEPKITTNIIPKPIDAGVVMKLITLKIFSNVVISFFIKGVTFEYASGTNNPSTR